MVNSILNIKTTNKIHESTGHNMQQLWKTLSCLVLG